MKHVSLYSLSVNLIRLSLEKMKPEVGLVTPDWFKTSLYTTELVNVIKWMKKNHVAVHIPPSIFGIKLNKLYHYIQHSLKNVVGYIFCIFQCWRINVHHRFVIFLRGLFPTQKLFISLEKYQYLLSLGTNPSKTGHELLYYHSYHEEEAFYLDRCLRLINSNYLFKITITYNNTNIIFD